MNPASRQQVSIHVVAAIVSGLLLTGAFHPWNQAWLAWLFPIPLLVVLRVAPAPGRRWVFGVGWLAGLVHFSTSLFWVTEVTVPGWVALSVLMACYPGLWLWLVEPVVRRLPQRLQAHHSLMLASYAGVVWTATEWVRSWFLTGFPWNLLGVSQIEVLVVAQIAEWGGTLLVGWVVVFGGGVVGMTLLRVFQEARHHQSIRPRVEFMAALVVVGVVVWFGIDRLTQPAPPRGTLDVLLVQPRIPQDPWGAGMPADEALERSIRLTELALSAGPAPDLVIWPETPIPDSLLDLREFPEFVHRIVPERAGAFLYGTIRRVGGEPFNSAVLALPGSILAETYDKMHLVIMGEYLPLGDVFPILRRWIPLGQDFSAGDGPEVFSLPSGWRFAPLICFEDVMARVVRRFLPLQPDVFVNITNDGWFNQSPQSLQHFQQARMRCIEFRRPMIRVANNGATGWIDERGSVRELLADVQTGSVDIAGTVRSRVPLPEIRETLYARWGDWVGILCTLTTAAVALLQFRAKSSR
jgi:apolipoprotein N-acyltransferase